MSNDELEAAKYAALVEEDEARERKRLDLVKDNIFDDVSFTNSTGNAVEASNKQSIVIPMLLKKLMVDEWSQISIGVPKTKLLRLPRPYSVASIISIFLQHKYSVLISNTTTEDAVENADIYESYVELFQGLQRYFDAALSAMLLYRNERIQLALLRKLFEEKYPEHPLVLSEIFGVEHLLRLMVKFPASLNSIPVMSADVIQDANKVVVLHSCASNCMGVYIF